MSVETHQAQPQEGFHANTDVAGGHTGLKIPDLFRPLKSNNPGPGQQCGGGPLGKTKVLPAFFGIRTHNKKDCEDRNVPTCTLSQNGYGADFSSFVKNARSHKQFFCQSRKATEAKAGRKAERYPPWPHLIADSFRGTSDKIGTIQRRLAWPLRRMTRTNREVCQVFWPSSPRIFF